ncbi:MAG: 2,3-bisphosphoglycerate-dependent phosphoglycerate mutase [Candidatus Levybacteria bacterium]|nr:2,3-bisphosphoglycerate-dependent phosphoglycerate mutase [Candidatus Levybacteria bacterium]
MAYLALVRHGMSAYNAKGLWTGWDDPSLTTEGVEQAKKAGESLADIQFHLGYTAALKRAKETLETIKNALNIGNLPTTENKAINERNYGDFTGKNKWEVKKLVGDEEFHKIRRGWDYPIPHGESLKQVYEREIPYFETEILPKLKEGRNIVLASSGNALRAIVKYLEHIPDDKISEFEIAIGEVLLYDIDKNGNIIKKDRRNTTNLVP